ncbi:MAG: hypothetical protein P794_04860 [Epsilonproteobacteria bacterium (ex Lamellibrachia satsuma)]|nr:MAG: hypothetical protein P794_04860 [Epsilonproteobacteria bacterium (ex Lamellibrachia satsuma)]
MVEFLKKAMDWVLQKEQDAANNCHIDINDLNKQITYIEEKRDKIKKDHEENMAEMEHILNRLHTIKASTMKCATK